MFNFFKRKKVFFHHDQTPVILPELSWQDITPEKMYELLQDSAGIITLSVFEFNDKLYGTFYLFRKEENYLVKYDADVLGYPPENILTLCEIFTLTPSNVWKIFNQTIFSADKVFVDENCEFSNHCHIKPHNVTKEMIEERLEFSRSFRVN